MPAQLHHERISRGDREPERWLLMTHGIYGAGSNWRVIARKLTDLRPEWGVVLVDLRGHGRSEPGEPPHTLAAAADDLRALIAEVRGVAAIAGHSFGGKVVLATRPLVPSIRQTWVFDANPGARDAALDAEHGSAMRVLELLERLPRTWARRDDFVDAVAAAGNPLRLAQWLGMNIVPAASGASGALVMRLDPAQLRALLADYFATELWDSAFDPAHGDLEVVLADRSSTVDAAARARLDAAPPHVHVHHIDADHWLHIEAPEAVVTVLAAELP